MYLPSSELGWAIAILIMFLASIPLFYFIFYSKLKEPMKRFVGILLILVGVSGVVTIVVIRVTETNTYSMMFWVFATTLFSLFAVFSLLGITVTYIRRKKRLGASAADVKCSYCGGIHLEGDTHCPECGKETLATVYNCPECDTPFIEETPYCENCGVDLEDYLNRVKRVEASLNERWIDLNKK